MTAGAEPMVMGGLDRSWCSRTECVHRYCDDHQANLPPAREGEQRVFSVMDLSSTCWLFPNGVDMGGEEDG